MAANLNIFDDDSISTWSNSQMNRFLEDMPGFGEEERGWKVVPSISGRLLNPKFHFYSTGKRFYEHRIFDDESSSSSALKEGKNKKRGREEEQEEDEKENRKKMKKCDQHVKNLSPMSWGEISSQIDNFNKIKEEMIRSKSRILELIDGTIQQLRKEKPRRVLFSNIL